MSEDLKEGTAYMVVGYGVSMLAGFAAQVIASRTLGPQVYGLYGLVIYNAALVSGFFDSGLSVAMATFIAEKDTQKDWREVLSIIGAGASIAVSVAVLFVCLYLLFNNWFAVKFFSGMKMLLVFCVIIIALQGAYGMLAGAIIGFRELKKMALIRIVQQVSLLLFMLLIIKGFSLGLRATLAVHLLSISLALSLTIFFIQRSLQGYQINEKKKKLLKYGSLKTNVRLICKYAVPVSVAALASSWIQSSGPAIISFFSKNDVPKQLGMFVIVLTLGRMINSVIITICRSIFPYLVSWNVEGSGQITKKYLHLMVLCVIVSYGLLILTSMLAGKQLINLIFGNAYVDASKYLPLAFIAFCTISLHNIYKTSLYSLKLPGKFLLINGVGVVAFLLSIFIGWYVFHLNDIFNLLLLSIALSNLIISVGSSSVFERHLVDQDESSLIPV